VRYQVPQNIDMEDKIIGPLTMAQFLYLMVGGMVLYLMYLTLIPVAFFGLGIPLGLVTLAFAFLKVQDQPLPKFLAATLLYLVRAKSRVWQKDASASYLKIVAKGPASTQPAAAPTSPVAQDELDELSQLLDSGAPITPSSHGGTQ